MTILTRRSLVGPVAMLVLAGALRAWFLALPRAITRDGATYAALGDHLVQGRGYTDLTGAIHTNLAPGYPLAIAALIPLGGDSERAALTVSFVTGLLTPLLVYGLGRRWFGARVGLLAGALTAIQPLLVDFSTRVMAQAAQNALIVAVVWAGMRALETERTRDILAAAALSAPLGILRPEGFTIPAVLGVLILLREVRARRLPWRAASFGVIALLPIAAYSLLLYRVRGVIGTGKWTHYQVILAPDYEATIHGLPPLSALGLARIAVRNLFELESTLAAQVSLLGVVLASVGAVAAARRLGHPGATFLIAAVAAPLALVATLSADAGYVIAVVPLILLLVALGVVDVAGRVSAARRPLVTVLLVAALVLHAVPGLTYPLRFSPWDDAQPTEHRMAGRLIRDHVGEGVVIMTRAPEVVYYARGVHVPIPVGDIVAVLERARAAGVALVVVDEALTRRLRPHLVALLDGPAPRGLRLVHEMTPHPGRRVRLFAPERP